MNFRSASIAIAGFVSVVAAVFAAAAQGMLPTVSGATACARHETVAEWGDLQVKRPHQNDDGYGTMTFCRGSVPVRQFRDENADRWIVRGANDLNGDGKPELDTYIYSGGAHCCTTHVIFRRNRANGRIEASRLDQGNGEVAEFRRLKGYPLPVMLLTDNSSAYEFSAYAWTVTMPYVVEIGDNGFQLSAPLMRSDRPGEGPAVLRQGPAAWRTFLTTMPPDYETELSQIKPTGERAAALQTRLSRVLASGRPPADWDAVRLDVERHLKLYCLYDARCDLDALVRQIEGRNCGSLRAFARTLNRSMRSSQIMRLRRGPVGWH